MPDSSAGRTPIASTTHRAIWRSLVALIGLSRDLDGIMLSFLTVVMFSAWASEGSTKPVSPGSNLM
jgi:hypothetical protein